MNFTLILPFLLPIKNSSVGSLNVNVVLSCVDVDVVPSCVDINVVLSCVDVNVVLSCVVESSGVSVNDGLIMSSLMPVIMQTQVL